MKEKKSVLKLMAMIALDDSLFSVTDTDLDNSTIVFSDVFTDVHGKLMINSKKSYSIILEEIIDKLPPKDNMDPFEENMTLTDYDVEIHPKLKFVDFKDHKKVLIRYDNISASESTTMYHLQAAITKIVVNTLRFRRFVNP